MRRPLMITIAVTIVAAISAATCLGAVQDQGHVLELLLLVEGIDFRQHAALHQA